jgi:hypothetical protein
MVTDKNHRPPQLERERERERERESFYTITVVEENGK